ncbi:MAG TPA: hypothetical protein VFL83_18375 [Anaeromyxobacter sp.]|nr:hypothetical protein [Anaeromyxobacter sp.]
MTRNGWCGAAAVGLLAAALGGCTHGGKQDRRATEARAPQSASERASRAEGQLAEARRRLDAARQDAARAEQQRGQARQQLSQAEQRAFQARQRIAQEQANVHRLDAGAREARRQAEEEAVRAQLAAEEAQGLRTAAGRISRASPSHLVVDLQGGGTMAFSVDPGTRVLVGTEQRSLSDLQQGAEVRVSYDPRAAEPSAVTIHVAPAREFAPDAGPPAQPPPQR